MVQRAGTTLRRLPAPPYACQVYEEQPDKLNLLALESIVLLLIIPEGAGHQISIVEWKSVELPEPHCIARNQHTSFTTPFFACDAKSDVGELRRAAQAWRGW